MTEVTEERREVRSRRRRNEGVKSKDVRKVREEEKRKEKELQSEKDGKRSKKAKCQIKNPEIRRWT